MEKEKILQFEDGSVAVFQVSDKAITFLFQARVLGQEIKTTATTVSLTPEETSDLINWLNEILQ